MAVGRDQRRSQRRERVEDQFCAADIEPALDLLELLEIGWHDCYGEISPSEDIVDDVLVISHGDLGDLIRAVRLALMDWRDVKVSAASIREAG